MSLGGLLFIGIMPVGQLALGVLGSLLGSTPRFSSVARSR